MAMEIKEDIKQLYEIRQRIAALVNLPQWVNASDFVKAYNGVQ